MTIFLSTYLNIKFLKPNILSNSDNNDEPTTASLLVLCVGLEKIETSNQDLFIYHMPVE